MLSPKLNSFLANGSLTKIKQQPATFISPFTTTTLLTPPCVSPELNSFLANGSLTKIKQQRATFISPFATTTLLTPPYVSPQVNNRNYHSNAKQQQLLKMFLQQINTKQMSLP
ncbi:hypothetical protein CDAR_198761 [Caerostris darwini]|uniref:Uncharacterized protein n=1 Tax=Caerostris darwini TaxID=1538125 RepID=A0AAV4W398_9ARAC|nr:hypothetical protein CDAR_198761 [Caerostris darwini]